MEKDQRQDSPIVGPGPQTTGLGVKLMEGTKWFLQKLEKSGSLPSPTLPLDLPS